MFFSILREFRSVSLYYGRLYSMGVEMVFSPRERRRA